MGKWDFLFERKSRLGRPAEERHGIRRLLKCWIKASILLKQLIDSAETTLLNQRGSFAETTLQKWLCWASLLLKQLATLLKRHCWINASYCVSPAITAEKPIFHLCSFCMHIITLCKCYIYDSLFCVFMHSYIMHMLCIWFVILCILSYSTLVYQCRWPNFALVIFSVSSECLRAFHPHCGRSSDNLTFKYFVICQI